MHRDLHRHRECICRFSAAEVRKPKQNIFLLSVESLAVGAVKEANMCMVIHRGVNNATNNDVDMM